MVKKVMWATGIICLLLGLGGQTARAQFGQMQGFVKGEDGKPFANGIISIDREDVTAHYEVKTNKDGNFFHAGLPLGRFSVSVMENGKKKFTLGGFQTRLSAPVKVEIDLQQERMRTEAAASGIAVGDQPKLTQEQMEAIQKASNEK